MTPQQGSSNQNSSPSFLNDSLNPNTNTTSTTTPLSLNPSFNPNTTTTNHHHAASASYDSITSPLNSSINHSTTNNNDVNSDVASRRYYYFDNNMNPHHASSGIYDSTHYPLNPDFDPFANTNTIPTPTIVENTTTNNNVAGSEINNDVGVNNNNIMNLQWDSEYPPGYRFCPTDVELVYHYLQRRIMNLELPHNKIQDINLYDTTPIKLSQEYKPIGENEWYFFTPRDRKYKNGERPNRAAGTSLGFWKATGAEKPVHHPKNPTKIIGHKRSLVFYLGNDRKNGIKTNWIMQEFRLHTTKRKKLHDDDMGLDWVLCKLYCNNKNDKGSKGKNNLEIGEAKPEEAKVAALNEQQFEQFPPIPNDLCFDMDEDDVMLFPDDLEVDYANELDCPLNNITEQEMIMIRQAMCNIYHSNYCQQGFHNAETTSVVNQSGCYQGESFGGQGFLNPSEYYDFQRDASGEQNLTQLSSTMSLDNNVELHFNNSVAPPNNPSSDAPPS